MNGVKFTHGLVTSAVQLSHILLIGGSHVSAMRNLTRSVGIWDGPRTLRIEHPREK
jgi:hypothetical protein